tara:strand:- start:639 stop:824 length:186 start_codon:yes stop_codon:yes gene_type:complete
MTMLSKRMMLVDTAERRAKRAASEESGERREWRAKRVASEESGERRERRAKRAASEASFLG